jgi:hypothetical protein
LPILNRLLARMRLHEFRQRLREKPETVCWQELYRLTNEDGSVRDVFRVWSAEQLSKEGDRLLWFHSRGKQDTDAATRARRWQRAIRELTDLRERLAGQRTRFRDQQKVTSAVEAILDAYDARDVLRVEIPGKSTATNSTGPPRARASSR